MNKNIKFCIKESDHQIYGIGNVYIEFIQNDTKCEYKVQIPDLVSGVKKFEGDEAFFLYNNIGNYRTGRIETIKKCAAKACEIPVWMLSSQTRQENVYFARYLVMWKIRNEIKGLSYSTIGGLFGLDNSTAIYACNTCSDENAKFIKPIQSEWKSKFLELINEKKEKVD